MTEDSTVSSYWLNWRFLLCSISVILPMLAACLLIWKRESYNSDRHNKEEVSEELLGEHFHVEECWLTCFENVHPGWLLLLRFLAFLSLTALLVVDFVTNGWSMFLFYTQWTCFLLIIYFGVGCLLSIYGYNELLTKLEEFGENMLVAERTFFYVTSRIGSRINVPITTRELSNRANCKIKNIAEILSHIFKIIFPICAGAVMLTDVVFWLFIFPFRAMRDYKLTFVLIGTHSLNLVFLLGDSVLNRMPFPWFRIAYFILWTGIYVIFQWIIHACLPLWWPYPILDLSSPYAPIWYLVVALLHFPCYAIYALIMKVKHKLLWRRFVLKYQNP